MTTGVSLSLSLSLSLFLSLSLSLSEESSFADPHHIRHRFDIYFKMYANTCIKVTSPIQIFLLVISLF